MNPSSITEDIIDDIALKDDIEHGNHFVEQINSDPNNNTNIIKNAFQWFKLIKLLIFLIIWGYFIWATIHYTTKSDEPFGDTLRSGYGFLTILIIIINTIIIYRMILGKLIKSLTKIFYKPLEKISNKIRYLNIIFYLSCVITSITYLIYDARNELERLISLSGLTFFLLFGFLLSNNRMIIPWRTIISGILLQFLMGVITIRWSVGRQIFDCLGEKVTTFLSYAVKGSTFVYGDLLVNELGVFAFKTLCTIYFMGFIINILYYYGIMQNTILILGRLLQRLMHTSICESVNSAANIFLSMSEAPLLLKPYLNHLTDSELHTVMTSGFATVSGSVFAGYINFGASPAHLIISSVMSAPAALCYSKLLCPECEEVHTTKHNVKAVKIEYDSVMDAASRGAYEAHHMITGIISNVIAFLAFVYFLNGIVGWLGELVGYTDDYVWTIENGVGKLFIPISFMMGVPWDECEKVGKLIGLKTIVNEFVAFQQMSTMELTGRSKTIATYAICGFSNPGSIGIAVSSLSILCPDKRASIMRLVFRAFLGGAIVCFMTASIAGLLITKDNYE